MSSSIFTTASCVTCKGNVLSWGNKNPLQENTVSLTIQAACLTWAELLALGELYSMSGSAWRLFVLVCALLVAPNVVAAQAFEVTPEAARYVNGVINESINANTLLSTQDEVSTGSFTQRQDGEPDKSYRTVRLPVEALLGSVDDEPVTGFVNGNLAYLRSTSGLAPIDGAGANDFAVTDLYAASAGVGMYVKLSKSLLVAPAVSLTYSRIDNSYDFNNLYSQSYLTQVGQQLFNWGMDLLTYAPEVKLFYQAEVGSTKLEYQLGYVYLFNDSIRTESPVIDINSSTGLLINRVAVNVPTGAAVLEAPLAIRPFFQWSNISGHAVAGLGLRDIFEVGADLIVDVVQCGVWISHVTLGGSYVSGKDFEGYHIGIGVDF
jgi:hypothetical protein